MDKKQRKIVHDIANAFNIKSKSIGNGAKRFPCLYRTSRTISYSESSFATVVRRVSQRFFPRMDRGKIGGGIRAMRAGDQRGGTAAASHRDGDVVGAGAPELGAENKGRAILERMGWSTGTALGALNNKGMLQPVSHIVKNTKAGLG